MFSVLFEVHPEPSQWEAYLDYAKMLRPELEGSRGFIDNIRYRSLRREGWILSLSNWQNEKALIRWRTHALHHDVQEKGRSEVLLDYHLRVGELTADTSPPNGAAAKEQRLDETEIGEGTTVLLVNAQHSKEWLESKCSEDVARSLGLAPETQGFISWDVFDAVQQPGDVILLMTFKQASDATRFKSGGTLPDGARLRQVRVIRDYGMFDRREAPQYYAEAKHR